MDFVRMIISFMVCVMEGVRLFEMSHAGVKKGLSRLDE